MPRPIVPLALIATCCSAVLVFSALAQAPAGGTAPAGATPPTPPAATAPAAPPQAPAPTTPAPAAATAPPPAAIPPAATPSAAPSNPPPAAAAPDTTPAPPAVAPAAPSSAEAPKPADPVASAQFGEEIELAARPALTQEGKASWDELYSTLKTVIANLQKVARDNGLQVSGAPLVRFASSGDDDANFIAMLPVVSFPAGSEAKLGSAKAGTTPAGKTLRFLHLGGYDTIGQTYDEVANHLDERNLSSDEVFIEEYARDPATTKEADLATFIYVFPTKPGGAK